MTIYDLPVVVNVDDAGDVCVIVYEVIPVSLSIQERLIAEDDAAVARTPDGTAGVSVVIVEVEVNGLYKPPG